MATNLEIVRNFKVGLTPNIASPAIIPGVETTLWTTGVDHPVMRIPAVCQTTLGTVIAFAEARTSTSDSGYIFIVAKRKVAGATAFSAEAIIAQAPNMSDRRANPTAIVVERGVHAGRVLLIYGGSLNADTQTTITNGTSTDISRVYVKYSDDDGVTWSAEREITTSVQAASTNRFLNPGPGNVRQTNGGPNGNRIVIPMYHTDPAYPVSATTGQLRNHTVISDDGGDTFGVGQVFTVDGANEWKLGQFPNGSLYGLTRVEGGSLCKYINSDTSNLAASPNPSLFGKSFSAITRTDDIQSATCNSGLVMLPDGRVLISTPVTPTASRANLTMYGCAPRDAGGTFPYRSVLNSGLAAYSDMFLLANGKIALLYESGNPTILMQYQEIQAVVGPEQYVAGIFNQ